ncbi:MAG: HAD-IA family hydrolase [Candidatus Omnitrophica bacterium]|nr:HAD-IA family hydrolase [Candidatus Omnitrophota bacterium]
MKRLIVYDLDGTLVDTLQDITNAANHMLKRLQRPPLAAERVRRFVGRGVAQLVAECLATDDAQRITEGLAIYRAHYREHLVDHSRLYPGARELLEHFRNRAQAVITNKPNPDSRELLRRLGVADYFLDIIGGDGPYPKKPDPAALQSTMERASASADETLLIGDSPIDVETGRRAGVPTVTVSHGLADAAELAAAHPDLAVDDFGELLGLAKSRGW